MVTFFASTKPHQNASKHESCAYIIPVMIHLRESSIVLNLHALHTTGLWSRSEGLWTGPIHLHTHTIPTPQHTGPGDKSPLIIDQHKAGAQ